MHRIVALALFAFATPVAAQEPTCEEELADVLAELESHGAAMSSRIDATCEEELDDALAVWDQVHRGVSIDEVPEAGVCVERCSCGYCLRWGREVELDHVGTYNFVVEIEG